MKRIALAVAVTLFACTSQPGDPGFAPEASHAVAQQSWVFRPVVGLRDDAVWGKTFAVSYLTDGTADATLAVKLNGANVYSETRQSVAGGVSGWLVATHLTAGAVYDYTLTHGSLSFTGWMRIPDHTSKSFFDMKFYGDSQHRTSFECDITFDKDAYACQHDGNGNLLGGTGAHHLAVATAVGNGSKQGGPFYKADPRNHPDVIVPLGDATCDNTDSSIFEFLDYESAYAGASHSPLFYVLGNHDYWQEGTGGIYASPELNGDLGVPQTYGSFDYNNVHVLTLDTGHDGVIDDAQLAFIEADLKKAAADTNTDFIFVTMHRSLFSDHLSSCDFGDADDLIGKLEPLFKTYNVSAVLAGHNHQYERFDRGYGTPYYVVGTGGGQIYLDGASQTDCRASGADRKGGSSVLGYLNARIGIAQDGVTPIATFSFVPLDIFPPFAPGAPEDTVVVESRPVAPTEVTASIAGHNPAMTTLSWKDNSNRETGYRIEYQLGTVFGGAAGAWSVLPNAGALAANTTSFTFPDPAPGQWVNYRVTAMAKLVNNLWRYSAPGETTFRFPGCQPEMVAEDMPYTTLTGGVYLAAGAQTTGQFTAPAAGSYKFWMNADSGDSDLYMRRDAPPTMQTFDCRPYTGASNETCTLTLHNGETVYWMIEGYTTSTNVQLGVSTPSLLGSVGSHGVVYHPLMAQTPIAGGQDKTGQLVANRALSGDFDIRLAGSGDADLYVRKNAAPTYAQFDCRSWGNTSTESCKVHLEPGDTLDWMVHGFAAASTVQLDAVTGSVLHVKWWAGQDCPADGLVRYDVYRADESHLDGEFVVWDWSKIGEVPAGAPLKFADDSYSCGGMAKYSVTAVYADHESEGSAPSSFAMLPTDVCKPDLVGTEFPAMGQMLAYWSDEGAGATATPLVQRSADGGKTWAGVAGQIDDWQTGAPSEWDTALSCNAAYQYRVAYTAADGSVVYSHPAWGTTTSCLDTPSNPGLTADRGELDLHWAFSSPLPTTGFEITRSDTASGMTVLLQDLPVSASSYRNSLLACDKQYSYAVRAYRDVYDSSSNTMVRHYGLPAPTVSGSPSCQ